MTPLLMTLGVAFLLLLLERMLRLFDFVVNQGGPVEVVFRLLGNLVPHYLGFALPLGLFLGILVAFRKLSLSSELDAILSSGIGLSRLLRPAMGLAVFLLIINFILIGFVQPYSRYSYRGLVFDLRSGALGASVKVGEYVNIGNGMVLRIEGSRNNGAELLGIFLERTLDDGRQIAVTAERGGFFATPDQQNVILRLFDGRLINLNDRQEKPSVLVFDQQDISVKLPEMEPFRDRGEEQLELTIFELLGAVKDKSRSPQVHNELRANLHWRLATTFVFIILPIFAIPLGITNKRTGKSLGLVVGLTTVILLNEFMEVAETLVAQGAISPYVSMWALYGAFALLALHFFNISANHVGGEPLAWIDKMAEGMRRPLKRATHKVTDAIT